MQMRCGLRPFPPYTHPSDPAMAKVVSALWMPTYLARCNRRTPFIPLWYRKIRCSDGQSLCDHFRLTCDEAPEEAAAIRSEKILKLDCNISSSTNYLLDGIKEVSRRSFSWSVNPRSRLMATCEIVYIIPCRASTSRSRRPVQRSAGLQSTISKSIHKSPRQTPTLRFSCCEYRKSRLDRLPSTLTIRKLRTAATRRQACIDSAFRYQTWCASIGERIYSKILENDRGASPT